MPGVFPRAVAARSIMRRARAGIAFRSTALLGAGSGLVSLAGPVFAQPTGTIAGMPVGTFEVIQLSVIAGVLGAALLSATWMIRERARIAAENEDLRARLSDANAAILRADALLNLKDQRIIVWGADRKRPDVVGGLPIATGVPEDRSAFLAFGRWLSPRSAASLESAITGLREAGTGFDLVVETQSGTLLEASGRTSAAGHAVRFLSLTEARQAHAALQAQHAVLSADHANLRGLLDALDMPAWVRDENGRLRWVNSAYAAAVEAASPEAAVAGAMEILGTPAREGIARHHFASPVFRQTLSTVIRGDRLMYAVTDFKSAFGGAGIASDVSAIESIRDEHLQTVRSHAETLDQLTTAVAIFGADQKLRFYNQAFQKLWGLEQAFLESSPENALLLDRLRTDGKLAEQPEWRRWKDHLLTAYRAVDPQEHWWHLPDGRTIRVVANPSPKGGVTWVFENLTEQINLESRYNTALRVQGETLDNLAEGVAVFGSDGRARLVNPAFVKLWNFDPSIVEAGVHVSVLRAAASGMAIGTPWEDFSAIVTGFDEERRDRHGQVELRNGLVLRYALIYLPNAQVMMTFVDVTDSVNVERALKDKNEALQRADQLKNEFVQHVSYELRSPLTNIIGFTDLLALPETGALTQRQRDYLDHIGSSSAMLLTVINDILDLATVDAGIMELELGDVPIGGTLEAAGALVADRLKEHDITLRIVADQHPASLRADPFRLKQILFNLLSNAANYAPAGSEIVLSFRDRGDVLEFSVQDSGPGMPPEVVDTVFRRFEPRVNGGRRRGAGLGLSLVKSFTELHGGSVDIRTGPNAGTSVTCRFPLRPNDMQDAAE